MGEQVAIPLPLRMASAHPTARQGWRRASPRIDLAPLSALRQRRLWYRSELCWPSWALDPELALARRRDNEIVELDARQTFRPYPPPTGQHRRTATVPGLLAISEEGPLSTSPEECPAG